MSIDKDLFEQSDSGSEDDGIQTLQEQPTHYFGLQSQNSFEVESEIDPEEQKIQESHIQKQEEIKLTYVLEL